MVYTPVLYWGGKGPILLREGVKEVVASPLPQFIRPVRAIYVTRLHNLGLLEIMECLITVFSFKE